MKNNRIQSREKKKPPVILWIFAAVLISFMLSFFLGQSGVLRLGELRSESDRMIMENHRLAMENRRLSDEIRRLREDPATIEKIAREELHFVSQSDLVFLVPR